MPVDSSQDEQLALLASILEPTILPLARLTRALKNAKGDVGRAAESLLLDQSSSVGSGSSHDGPKRVNRKGDGSITSWLGKRKRTTKGPIFEEDKDQPVEQSLTFSPSPPSTAAKPKDEKREVTPVDLMKILRQPPPNLKTPPRPPIYLATQAAIDAHNVPLSFLPSPLSPALASALYLTMMRESEKWERHQWYLAGRWVESPHLMSGYQRALPSQTGPDRGENSTGGQCDAEPNSMANPRSSDKPTAPDDDVHYFYSGAELSKDQHYPSLLAQAADLIEPVVNAHLASRPRYPWEYAGEWRANRCGANRYDGAASGVGWHADQLTYLGPYCLIASLSLGTSRRFRVRETKEIKVDSKGSGPSTEVGPGKDIRTYEVNLDHNSLVLMDPGCQERFKHTIPPQKALDIFRPGFDIDQKPIPMDEQRGYSSRINITFRFYRPDFHPLAGTGPFGPRDATPMCKCGIPALLRADQKAKARINLRSSPRKTVAGDGMKVENGTGTGRGSSTASHDERYSTAKEEDDEESKPSELVENLQQPAALRIKLDDMAFFWQCQSPGRTGDLKGCGFFKMLDMRSEGRGPSVVDLKDGRVAG